MQFDPAKARTLASRAYQSIIDDAPAIWLYDVVYILGHHKRLVLTPFRPDGWHNFVADWSIPPNQRIDRDRIGLRAAKP
jgi:peptide/nickel transport system substrate-binding protein